MPARLAYAAMAAPAFPLVGIASLVTPSSLAIETAMQSPRALKEPVGNRPSSLTITRPSPVLNPTSSTSGVMISPRLTMFSARRTGRNSR